LENDFENIGLAEFLIGCLKIFSFLNQVWYSSPKQDFEKVLSLSKRGFEQFLRNSPF